MNDLPDMLPPNSCVMHADDITLYCSSDNIKNCQSNLQDIINCIVKWLDVNRLIINTSKSHSIMFGSKNKISNCNLNVHIKDKILSQISDCKLLGIYIDENLTWKKHCTELCKKMSKKFGLMKRLRSVLPLHTISVLYYPFIQSHIDYCITVWGNTNVSILANIQKLQNRVARFLTSKYDYNKYPSLTLLKDLGWMTVSQRYTYFISILMYNCINFPEVNAPLSNCFDFVKNNHFYPTRHATKGLKGAIKRPFPRTKHY